MFSRPTTQPVSSKVSEHASKQLEGLRVRHQAILCSDAQERTHSRFVGEVTSIRVVPRGSSFWLEVVIGDGTGKINGWFFGRKSIAGIHPGSLLMFEGLVQLDQAEMTIANPYYEFV